MTYNLILWKYKNEWSSTNRCIQYLYHVYQMQLAFWKMLKCFRYLYIYILCDCASVLSLHTHTHTCTRGHTHTHGYTHTHTHTLQEYLKALHDCYENWLGKEEHHSWHGNTQVLVRSTQVIMKSTEVHNSR